jgi:hypothetical protein
MSALQSLLQQCERYQVQSPRTPTPTTATAATAAKVEKILLVRDGRTQKKRSSQCSSTGDPGLDAYLGGDGVPVWAGLVEVVGNRCVRLQFTVPWLMGVMVVHLERPNSVCSWSVNI